MGRSVGEAAAEAVRKSEKSKATDRTPEQILVDIRRNLAARLAVMPLDTAFLLAQYDALQARIDELLGVNGELLLLVGSLKEQNEQFRTVYEAENRSQAVTVERVAEPVVTDGDNQ